MYVITFTVKVVAFNTEDGSSTVLWNVGIQPPHYMVQLTKPEILSNLTSGLM